MAPPSPLRLDELVPSWHWRGRHTIIVDAPPDATFDMLGQLRVADLPRGGRHQVRQQGVRVLDDLLRQGFRLFVEERPEGFLMGRIGRFWNRYEQRMAPETARSDPAWFARFSEPGFAKAALAVTCAPVGEDATLLVAETRIVATDDQTLQEFNRHWLVGAWANPHAQEVLLRAVHRRLAR